MSAATRDYLLTLAITVGTTLLVIAAFDTILVQIWYTAPLWLRVAMWFLSAGLMIPPLLALIRPEIAAYRQEQGRNEGQE